ncbi:DUF4149 domain-containing protein [Polaromonas sp.]|uniref:DUF4149 domain-containing protein n=1 Tax=Polaromonas sp. TaxID=1869339 RepID=UPI003524579D
MSVNTRSRISILLAALWWGSLSTLGFLVVPLLFVHLPSPAAAGAMAAKLFTAQTWLSIACTFFLLLFLKGKEAVALTQPAQDAMKYVVAGLLLAVLIEFAVSPRIVSARADGGNLQLWHGLGSAMYAAQWLAAGWTLWCLSRTTKDGAA